MQGLAETSQVYEAQKLRELEIFPSAWMGFGLNTWKSDSSEHTGWMEKLQNCGQHDTFHTHRGCWIKQRESDSLPLFFSKRAQSSQEQEETQQPSPFRRDKFMVRMKEKLCLCSQHLKQKRAGSTACRAYMDNVETLLHPTCSLQGLDLFCFFSKAMQL